MPEFDSLFPDAKLDDEILDAEAGQIWKCSTQGKCLTCSQDTHWIEICCENFVCSTECSKQFWEGFFEAVKNVSRDDRDDGEPAF